MTLPKADFPLLWLWVASAGYLLGHFLLAPWVRRLFALSLLLLGVAASSSGAAPPVSLSVSPRFAFAGTGLQVTVRVERHAGNRRLTLLWDGPLSGSTDRPHEGEAASSSIRFEREFRSLQAGTTYLQAILTRVNDSGQIISLSSAVEEVQILEGIPQ